MIHNNLFLDTTKQSVCRRFMARFKKVWQGQTLADFDKHVLLILRNRAWLSGSVSAVLRIAQMSLQMGAWFGPKLQCSEEVKTECYGEYNEEMMEPLTPTVGYILRAIIIVEAILCILCFKWRFLADYFFHIE